MRRALLHGPLLRGIDARFFRALARAFGGAILFALPLLMTMEMWDLPLAVPPWRLAVFTLAALPLLTGLAWHAGFRHDVSWTDAAVDAGVAYLVGFSASAAALLLLAALGSGTDLTGNLARVALQAIPAAMGAAVARSQLGAAAQEDEERPQRESYAGELFLIGAGGLFFAFNVAPTEEIVLITLRQAHPLHALATMAASIALMHAFVYAVGFKGQHGWRVGRSGTAEFFALTLVGYALVLLVSAAVLGLFGRLDGQDPGAILHLAVVLAFPAALGGAVARLVL